MLADVDVEMRLFCLRGLRTRAVGDSETLDPVCAVFYYEWFTIGALAEILISCIEVSFMVNWIYLDITRRIREEDFFLLEIMSRSVSELITQSDQGIFPNDILTHLMMNPPPNLTLILNDQEIIYTLIR